MRSYCFKRFFQRL